MVRTWARRSPLARVLFCAWRTCARRSPLAGAFLCVANAGERGLFQSACEKVCGDVGGGGGGGVVGNFLGERFAWGERL